MIEVLNLIVNDIKKESPELEDKATEYLRQLRDVYNGDDKYKIKEITKNDKCGLQSSQIVHH